MTEGIYGFSGEYSWLSNMYPCKVHYMGRDFRSSENAYVFAKCPTQSFYDEIVDLDPHKAKKVGQGVILAKNWDSKKTRAMEDIVYDKFYRNKDLKDKLLKTGDCYIEETNYWKDTFWGVCDGKGSNNLGKILMSVRNLLKVCEILY